MTDARCKNCERPLIPVTGDWKGRQWMHRPIGPEAHAFYYCTIMPHVPLTSNPHAEPGDET